MTGVYRRGMKEITCPNCQKNFNLDDAGFADILAQVRNTEFGRDQVH
jgi:hypothetical protein